ncbi:2-octaprenyl-6-methoxyphenyl hydroxylase [Kangiella japonica]|uniref:2-octaprenyl-6-methoxyphenyl hydroxylase n=1 Tax=Kangiella japonica TaxID=647384 RepID=A0ABN0SYV8_9GAMM
MASINDSYPVAIVGGGMAGASLALALAKRGVACVVFEAFALSEQSQPSFDDRTVALSKASLNILANLDLLEDLARVSEAIKTIHVSEQGHIGFARLSAEENAVKQLGAVVENWQLGKVLHQAFAKQAELIDYVVPAKVLELEQSQDSAELTVEAHGKIVKVNAQLVVLADGARSPLRKKLHIDSEKRDFEASAVVCNLSTQLPHRNQAFERFTNDGPLALLPLSRQRMALVWSKPRHQAEQYVTMPEDQFAKDLEEAFGARLGRITKVGKRQSFPLVQSRAETLVRGRCVLVGNAAQSLHPIAGQGFNLGLRDISVLSELLAGAEDYGDFHVLNQYQELRQSDREQTLCVTESLARLFSNDWAPLSLTRNLLLKTMDIVPSAKSIFAQQAMGFGFKNSELAANDE